MNLLWVQAGRFLPMDSGGRIRSTQTIRALQANHKVTVVSCYRSRLRDSEYERQLQETFSDSVAIWMGRSRRSSLRYRFPVRFVASLTMELSAPRSARERIAALLGSGNHDAVIADFVFAAPYVPDPSPVPLLVDSHNVEYRSVESFLPRPWNVPLWLALKAAAIRTRRFERAQLLRANHTFATSEIEAELFRKLAPGASISVAGTGVDLAEFPATPLPPEAPTATVVFTGNMSYFPNVEAVEWFCSQVWPYVLAERPDARFRIVGKAPTASVRALASPTVEVTGRVESVAPHLRDAAVVVLPILSGSGTRLKVFEAMATGRPIVATTFAPEGLGVRDGHDMVLTDDPQLFAHEIVRFLRDRRRAEAFGRAAAEMAARNSWAAVGERISVVLDQVVRGS